MTTPVESAHDFKAEARNDSPKRPGNVHIDSLEPKGGDADAGAADRERMRRMLRAGRVTNETTDPETGLVLNSDGTVTVYHHTTREAALKIKRTKRLKAQAEPDVYVTTHARGDTGYGDGSVVALKVKPEQLQLDDEFPNGRKDFRLSVGRPGGSIRVKVGTVMLREGAMVDERVASVEDLEQYAQENPEDVKAQVVVELMRHGRLKPRHVPVPKDRYSAYNQSSYFVVAGTDYTIRVSDHEANAYLAVSQGADFDLVIGQERFGSGTSMRKLVTIGGSLFKRDKRTKSGYRREDVSPRYEHVGKVDLKRALREIEAFIRKPSKPPVPKGFVPFEEVQAKRANEGLADDGLGKEPEPPLRNPARFAKRPKGGGLTKGDDTKYEDGNDTMELDEKRETMKGVTYLVDPSVQELIGFIKRNNKFYSDIVVRGLRHTDGSSYWWAAFHETHESFARKVLGVSNFVGHYPDSPTISVYYQGRGFRTYVSAWAQKDPNVRRLEKGLKKNLKEALDEEQLDEHVKGVRNMAKRGFQVVDHGSIGWFKVYSAVQLERGEDGEIMSLADYRKAKPGYIQPDHAILHGKTIGDIQKNIADAVRFLSKLGIPRQRTTLIYFPIKDRNPITGGGVGGWASRKAHYIAVDSEMLTSAPDRAVELLIHEYAHSIWFRLPKYLQDFFKSWFKTNIAEPGMEFAQRMRPEEATLRELRQEFKRAFNAEWGNGRGKVPLNVAVEMYKRDGGLSMRDYIIERFKTEEHVKLYGRMRNEMAGTLRFGRGETPPALTKGMYAQIEHAGTPGKYAITGAKGKDYQGLAAAVTPVSATLESLLTVYFNLNVNETLKRNKKRLTRTKHKKSHVEFENLKNLFPDLTTYLTKRADNKYFLALDAGFQAARKYLKWRPENSGWYDRMQVGDTVESFQRWKANAEGGHFDFDSTLDGIFALVVSFQRAVASAADLGKPAAVEVRRHLAKEGVAPSAYATANPSELWAELIAYMATAPDRVSKPLRKAFAKMMQGDVRESIDTVELDEGKKRVGYKVMRIERGKAVAGADSRQSFTPRKGKVVRMSGNGIYMSLGKQYVLDYYSGLADDEVLITFEFDPDDLTTGNLTDRETEFSVPSAKIVKFEKVEEALLEGSFTAKDKPVNETDIRDAASELEQQAYSKVNVSYRPADRMLHSCATCVHFQKIALRSCAKVKGDIDPMDTCDLHETDRASLQVQSVKDSVPPIPGAHPPHTTHSLSSDTNFALDGRTTLRPKDAPIRTHTDRRWSAVFGEAVANPASMDQVEKAVRTIATAVGGGQYGSLMWNAETRDLWWKRTPGFANAANRAARVRSMKEALLAVDGVERLTVSERDPEGAYVNLEPALKDDRNNLDVVRQKTKNASALRTKDVEMREADTEFTQDQVQQTNMKGVTYSKSAYYEEDVQAYYDMQIALGLSVGEALSRTKQQFKLKSLKVNPAGVIQVQGLQKRPLPPPPEGDGKPA